MLAGADLAAVEASFPPPAKYKFSRRFNGEFFVGLTLGRLSCRNFYLAKVHFGPGEEPPLTVAQHGLAPGHACFELMAPRVPGPGLASLRVSPPRRLWQSRSSGHRIASGTGTSLALP